MKKLALIITGLLMLSCVAANAAQECDQFGQTSLCTRLPARDGVRPTLCDAMPITVWVLTWMLGSQIYTDTGVFSTLQKCMIERDLMITMDQRSGNPSGYPSLSECRAVKVQ